MNTKRKRGRPVGSTGASSIIRKTIESMGDGDSVTFTRELDLQKGDAATQFTHAIGAYLARGAPGISHEYETFRTITSKNRVIVGVIVTRVG